MLTNNMGKKKWGVLRETSTLEVESENNVHGKESNTFD